MVHKSEIHDDIKLCVVNGLLIYQSQKNSILKKTLEAEFNTDIMRSETVLFKHLCKT
jgi:hydroxymethylpyrimidine pyrophosphatase-like HAD family hydrolase